ncbi:MAG: adenine deaminase [Anaerolineae bacterium]|nr:adenine deaminase [Anaerolineae bacterium]
MNLEERIAVARGEKPADLVLRNARLVNVLSGEIHPADVAIWEGYVVGVGEGYQGREELDLEGRYLCPGFLDGHLHIESTLLTVAEFARAVVPHGTTAVVLDPHEIANVAGVEGIRYFLDSSEGAACTVYVMLPSCVPATDMETSGAVLTADDLAPLLAHPRVLGIAEMMNYPGVLLRAPGVLRKVALAAGRPVDGHAPGLTGHDLNAYIAAGIRSDHECTALEEAREKLRRGVYIMLREGTTAHNLRDLLPLVTPANARRFVLVSDDRHPDDLLDQGHMDHSLRLAIAAGLDPVVAVQMATLNTAEYFGLRDLGAVAPGYRADLVVLDDLQHVRVQMVFKDGRLVAQEGQLLPTAPQPPKVPLGNTMRVDWSRVDFRVPAEGTRVRVIQVLPDQVLTRALVEEVRAEGGLAVADPVRDLAKLAVIERHHASGNMAVGFARGFGLRRGALASTVGHDAHNLVVVGVDDDDMLLAARHLVDLGGGFVAVAGGRVLADVPLPIGGLMSDLPVEEVRERMDWLLDVAQDALGSTLPNPFMTLSFVALAVIPELRLTDKGLVDVTQFQFVPLFVS